jgi:hypothetical protein
MIALSTVSSFTLGVVAQLLIRINNVKTISKIDIDTLTFIVQSPFLVLIFKITAAAHWIYPD